MTEEAKQTIEYVIGRMGDALEAAGGPASHVYSVLVRQATAEGAIDLLIGLVALVAVLVSIRLLRWGSARLYKWMKDNECASSDEEAVVFTSLLGGTLLLVVSAPTCISYLSSGVLRLANPEFYAISHLLGSL